MLDFLHKMVSKVLLLALIVGTPSAAMWASEHPEKPSKFAHKEGCYVWEINDVVPFGSIVSPLGHCYRINCSSRTVYYESCAVVRTGSPNCYITDEDVSKPYPYCCPTIKSRQ